ncbi:Ig-like domain-containing protein [Oceanithermus sp.]
MRKLVLMLAVPGLLAACGPKPPPPDTTPPRVVTAFPPDGYHGFKYGEAIALEFSEAMDAASVEQAFALLDGNQTLPVSFSWSADHRMATVSPQAPLVYSPNGNYRYYRYRLETGARDEAGNGLEQPLEVTFSTMRLHRVTLPAQPDLDGMIFSDNTHLTYATGGEVWLGDRDTNLCAHDFFSFDLGGLPDGLDQLASARVFVYNYGAVGSPFADLGDVWIDHLDYGETLEPADFELAALPDYQGVSGSLDATGSWSPGWFAFAGLSAWLQQDLEAERPRFQVRLRFAGCSDGDGQHDYLHLAPGEDTARAPYLEVDAYAP